MLERVTVTPESYMPRQPGMIQGNPFVQGFDAQETRTAQAEQRDAVRLERDNKEAFNTGLSGILADPSVANDPGKRSQAVAGLYSRTGQGREALSTLTTEDGRKRALEDKALTAYANGQTALGDQYASQSGTVIPDAIKNDGAMAGGVKMARDMGYDDPQQAATFAVNFKQTRDPKAASDAAGPPKPKQATYAPLYQLQSVTDPATGQTKVVKFNVHTGEATDSGYQGVVGRGTGGRAGAAGRPLAFEVKQQAWLAIPGHENDLEGAALFAAGKVGISRSDALKSALTTVRSLKDELGLPLYNTEQEVMDAAGRFADVLQGRTGNLSSVQPVPAPQAVAPPGTPSYTPGGELTGDPADPTRTMTDEQLLQYLEQTSGADMAPGVAHTRR